MTKLEKMEQALAMLSGFRGHAQWDHGRCAARDLACRWGG